MTEQYDQYSAGREDKRDREDGSQRVGNDQVNSENVEHEGSTRAVDSDSSWESKVSTYFSGGATHGTRQEIIGGILRQLRNLQAAHLAYVKAHRERLESRLKENETHQDNIAREMQALEEVVSKLLAFEQNQTDETL